MSLLDNSTLIPTEYEPSPSAERMVKSPRFGHGTDISVVFSEGREGTKDYVLGLIFGGCIVAAVFLIWSLVLCCFMCAGHKRVGFLSGFPFRKSNEDSDNAKRTESGGSDEGESDLNATRANSSLQQSADDVSVLTGWKDDEEDKLPHKSSSSTSKPKAIQRKKGGSSCCDRPTLIRGLFLFSGTVYIVFSILLVTNGITDLQNTITTIHGSAQDIDTIAMEGKEIIHAGVRDLPDTAGRVRDQLAKELEAEEFCPADPALDDSASFGDVRRQAEEVIAQLDDLERLSRQPLDQLEDAIDQVHDGASNVEKRTDGVDITDWESLLILILYCLVPAVLMSAIIMKFFDVTLPGLNCAINWFFLPLFIIMTVAAWIAASVMLIAAGANSDFCLPGGEVNSPDTTIYNILARQGFTREQYVYQVVQYYVDQCQNSEDPFAVIRGYLPDLDANANLLEELGGSFTNPEVLSALSLYCNRDFEALEGTVESLQQILTVLSTAIRQSLDLISCERIVPIYVNTVYDGTCTYSIQATFWIFSCALILGFFGMVMITLRASYKEAICPDGSDVGNVDDVDYDEKFDGPEVHRGDEVYPSETYIQEVTPIPRMDMEDEGIDLALKETFDESSLEENRDVEQAFASQTQTNDRDVEQAFRPQTETEGEGVEQDFNTQRIQATTSDDFTYDEFGDDYSATLKTTSARTDV